MARLNFLGLNMDATTEVQIIAAIRGLYPNLVLPTDSDNRAVQIVLKHIITEHLATWASRTAITGSPEDVANAARDQAVTTQANASAAARSVATTDIVPTAAS